MHFELTYKKKGSNRKKNSKIQGGLHNILPQTQLGDDVQSQLTQYFSSLSCSGNASHNASNPGPISHSDHHWGSALDINAQKEILGIDRSMRRRSYPHEDFNTSKMLKSLFGKDGLDVENRLSDPFPSMEGYGTVSQLLNESLFGTAEADELWHRPASIVRAEGDASEHFGQPNPQAPVFIPQRSRFSS